MQVFAIVVSLAITVVGVALFVRGDPARSWRRPARAAGVGRTDDRRRGGRRCSRRPWGTPGCCSGPRSGSRTGSCSSASALLFFTLVTAFGQLFDPHFALPVIGHWVVYEWVSELIAWAGAGLRSSC